MQSDTTVFFYRWNLFFFEKVAFIIAIHGQKTIQWQLNKVILLVMYNCKFEVISSVLNERIEKLEMEYGLFICTIIFYMMVCIRFAKKNLLMLSLR